MAGAASFDVRPRETSTLVDAAGELGAPPTPRVVRLDPSPVSGIAVASIPSSPAPPDGGAVVTTPDPEPLAPKLGNAGLDAGAEPIPVAPPPSEGDPGAPGGSGVAGEEDESSVEDVSRPIYEPALPPSAAPDTD